MAYKRRRESYSGANDKKPHTHTSNRHKATQSKGETHRRFIKSQKSNSRVVEALLSDSDNIDMRLIKSEINQFKQEKWGKKQIPYYSDRFSDTDRKALVRNHISYKEANLFNSRFCVRDIIKLNKSKIRAKRANKYDFEADAIKLLVSQKVPAIIANQYQDIDPSYIPFFYTIKLKPDELHKIDLEKFSKLFRQISSLDVFTKNPKKYSFIDTGLSGIIFYGYKNAWKFSLNIEEEVRLLRRIRNPKYIIKRKSDLIESIAVQLEFISGDTLEKKIKECSLTNEEILLYAYHICYGLVEMRKVGIMYHRDLRPANIMIDETKDRAVIIDLEKASTSKYYFPHINEYGTLSNTRFGGPNDLVSLGQIMYYMATGNHIFAKSESMTGSFRDIKHEINDFRTLLYSGKNDKVLHYYIHQIDSVLPGKENAILRELIKSCLTARRGHYKKMLRKFEHYVNEKK